MALETPHGKVFAPEKPLSFSTILAWGLPPPPEFEEDEEDNEWEGGWEDYWRGDPVLDDAYDIISKRWPQQEVLSLAWEDTGFPTSSSVHIYLMEQSPTVHHAGGYFEYLEDNVIFATLRGELTQEFLEAFLEHRVLYSAEHPYPTFLMGDLPTWISPGACPKPASIGSCGLL